MGLNGALQIGRSGLTIHQAALEVAGNNLANVNTEGYTRQVAVLTPASSIERSPGQWIGTGVTMSKILRATDDALVARVRTAISEQEGALTRQDLLTQIESILGGLDDNDLTGRLDDFFNAWSTLVSNPGDLSSQTQVIEQGKSLASFINGLNDQLTTVRTQVDESIRGEVSSVNELLDQIAAINIQIATAERGIGAANSLRDKRDQLIQQVSESIDISTIEQSNGTVDVFVGSNPIVLGTTNRGIKAEFTTDENGDRQVRMRVREDGTDLEAQSGRIGQLVESRESDVNAAIQGLNDFCAQLVYQVNRLHSQGQGTGQFESITGSYGVTDPSLSLSLDTDQTGLAFAMGHGSFNILVTDTSTNPPTQVPTTIYVDGDHTAPADTSLNDLVGMLNGVDHITASITSDNKLRIEADPNYEFAFSDDSCGVLAALGLNTFFTGSGSDDIAVNDVVANDTSLLAAGDETSNNGNAKRIADLYTQPLDDLDGASLQKSWAKQIEETAVKSSGAQADVTAAGIVKDSLESQRQAVSGVSIDEEAINLMTLQSGYQGAARFISVVDELMTTLMGLLG